MAFTNNLHLWDENNTNIDVSGDTQFSSQISDGFSSGSQVRSATFNLMWKEMSLVTTSLINALAPDTTVEASMTPSDLVTALQTALTSSASTASSISGGTAGDLLYQSAANTTAFVSYSGTGTKVLTSSGSAPQWTAQSSLTAGKATNLSGGASNKIPYQTGSNATGFINAPASDGQVLTYSSGSIQWATPSSVSTVENISGGVKGDLLYQSGVNTTAKLNIGTGNWILASTGQVPYWKNPIDITAGYAWDLKERSGRIRGSILYQDYTNPDVTKGVSFGASGSILQSNGWDATPPSWVSPSSLSVGYATNAGTAGTASNLSSGTAGQIPVQDAPGITGFLPYGTQGDVLWSDGNGRPPIWTSQSSLRAGEAAIAMNVYGGSENQIPIQSTLSSTTFIPAPTGSQRLVLTYSFDADLGEYTIGWKAP